MDSFRIASLDIGTSCLLMLISEVSSDGVFHILAEESAVPRLGENLVFTGSISPEALSRTSDLLIEFIQKAKSFNVNKIFVSATSALREASNQKEVLSFFSQKSGISIEVLSEQEEARLTYLSMVLDENDQEFGVIDIGGGSTEISFGKGKLFLQGQSLPIGTIKLRDQFLSSSPPTHQTLKKIRDTLQSILSGLQRWGFENHFLGTAGSFTHAASIDLKLEAYSPQKIFNHPLSIENIQNWIMKLSQMNWEEQKFIPGVDPRRVDTLLSGMLIMEALMRKGPIPLIRVKDRGIRFGKVFDFASTFFPSLQMEKNQ